MSDLTVIGGLLLLGGALVLISLLIVLVSRLIKRRLPKSAVVEFLRPANGSIFEHGLAVRADRKVLTAAIIDLAVRGQVRVLTSDNHRGPVAIEVVPAARLTAEEQQFLQSFRPPELTQRQERRYVRALQGIGLNVDSAEHAPNIMFLKGRAAFRGYRRKQLTEFFDATRARMQQDGFTRRRANSVHLVILSLIFLATAFIALILILGAALEGAWLGILAVLIDVTALFWVLTLAPPPLLRFTDQGNELRRYMSGLRDYMELTEQERIRLLQSPQGALRTRAGGLTPGGLALGLSPSPTAGDLVAQSELDRYVLTERLLPYAILFRQERQWQHEFEHLGGAIDVSRNMRTLNNTLNGIVVVLQVISVILQVLRVTGLILSLFARR